MEQNDRLELFLWGLILIAILGLILFVVLPAKAEGQETCPEGNGWIKVETEGEPMQLEITAPEGCLVDDVCTKRATILDWFYDQFVETFRVEYKDHAISHYSYTLACEVPTATPTEFEEEPTPTPPDEEPTATPTRREEPTPTPTLEEEPTATSTPVPIETPLSTPTKLPDGGVVFRTNPSLDAWRISSLNTWAGHNGLDHAIGEVWVENLWEGDLYLFNGTYWIVKSRFKVSPWDTWVIDSAPLVLISCSDWTGSEWKARWVWRLEPLEIESVR